LLSALPVTIQLHLLDLVISKKAKTEELAVLSTAQRELCAVRLLVQKIMGMDSWNDVRTKLGQKNTSDEQLMQYTRLLPADMKKKRGAKGDESMWDVSNIEPPALLRRFVAR
jgi:hypothetical protein